MNVLIDALRDELWIEYPDAKQMVRIAVRLLLAVTLTAIIGWEREVGHKTAGLRTHMLVSLGAALLTVSSLESTPNSGDVMRVVQGIAAGIGFIGGGAILKLESQNKIRGLTTAGTIWLAAAIGVSAGLGKIGAAAFGILVAWVILVVLERFKAKTHNRRHEDVPLPEG